MKNRVTRRDRGVNCEITLLRLEGEARGGSHGFVKMPAIDVETQRGASELCLEQGKIQLCKAAADIDHVTEGSRAAIARTARWSGSVRSFVPT